MENKPASALGYALGLWPDIERLEADCDVDSVSVISGAPLCKLKALSLVNRVGGQEWSVPALSQTAAAGLQELHFSNSYNPIPNLSIETVRGYSQLRKLSLFGCNISDVTPLAACVHLEDLSTCGQEGSDLSDLAPLGGCTKLKKLAIVASQVSDLASLRGCVELQQLHILWCGGLVSLEGLQACSKLERLGMGCLQAVSSLEPVCMWTA